MEKFHIQKIENEDKIEHNRELDLKLAEIQLSFADHIYHKKNLESLKFSEILKKKTSILSLIDTDRVSGEELNIRLDEIYQDGSENWKKRIMDFINENSIKIDYSSPEQKDDETAGAINFNVAESDSYNEGANTEEGINIHLSKTFLTGESVSLENVKRSFEKLAVIIVDRYPATKYVAGSSWIMDHPIMQRIGFKIVSRRDALNHISTWWQFIDKDGQVNAKRIKDLSEKEEPPMKVAQGYIRVEDFLQKFLPKERRGTVILEDVDKSEANEMRRKAKEFREKLKQSFGSITDEEFEGMFSEFPELLHAISTDSGKKILAFLKEKNREGIKLDDIEESDEIQKYNRDMNESIEEFYKKTYKVTKREVVIN